jgi:hypothetical protein
MFCTYEDIIQNYVPSDQKGRFQEVILIILFYHHLVTTKAFHNCKRNELDIVNRALKH